MVVIQSENVTSVDELFLSELISSFGRLDFNEAW